MIKLRSVVHRDLKRRKLLRGTFLALLGMSLIGYCGLFLSVQTLSTWGLPAFMVGSGLMAVGLVPFRQLNRLEIHPHQIILDQAYLQVGFCGKKSFSVPCHSIDRTVFISQGVGGIGIWLKEPLPEKIIVHDPRFAMRKFQEDSYRKHQCHLFLPHFNERAFKALQDEGIEDTKKK